jgi:hypothetical protein
MRSCSGRWKRRRAHNKCGETVKRRHGSAGLSEKSESRDVGYEIWYAEKQRSDSSEMQR